MRFARIALNLIVIGGLFVTILTIAQQSPVSSVSAFHWEETQWYPGRVDVKAAILGHRPDAVRITLHCLTRSGQHEVVIRYADGATEAGVWFARVDLPSGIGRIVKVKVDPLRVTGQSAERLFGR